MPDTEAEHAFLRASLPDWNCRWVREWLTLGPRSRNGISAFQADFRFWLRRVTQIVPAVEREFHLKMLFMRRIEERLAWTAESVRRIVDDESGSIVDIVVDPATSGFATFTTTAPTFEFKIERILPFPYAFPFARANSLALEPKFEPTLSYSLLVTLTFSYTRSPRTCVLCMDPDVHLPPRSSSYPRSLRGHRADHATETCPLLSSPEDLARPFVVAARTFHLGDPVAPPPRADAALLDQATEEWMHKFRRAKIPRGTMPEIAQELKWCRVMTKVLLALPQARRVQVLRSLWAEVARRVE
ncbi:hypothetical protein H9P43_006825 [Blastocladiella emersonii ATCC 22665]|nr:hypothetical protein H9P43_006825 [Blastocladiella emersonii ATCC 22665]